MLSSGAAVGSGDLRELGWSSAEGPAPHPAVAAVGGYTGVSWSLLSWHMRRQWALAIWVLLQAEAGKVRTEHPRWLSPELVPAHHYSWDAGQLPSGE